MSGLKKFLIGAGLFILLLTLAGWLLLGVYVFPGQESHSGQTALVNGNFLTMAADTPHVVTDRALLIENGTIHGFVPSGELPEQAERVDLQGGWATPGLFDLHVHLGGVPMAEGYGVPAMILEYARQFRNTRKKFLRYGVTSITSLGDMHPMTMNMRDRLRSGELAGPRLRVAGPTLTAPGGHPVSTIYRGRQRLIESAARQLAHPDSARQVVDNLVEDGVDLIKIIYTAGRNDTLPRMKYPVMEAIVDRAHRHGRKAVVHVDTRKDLADAIRAGADGVEHLAIGPGREADSLLTAMAEREVVQVPTLAVMDSFMDEQRMDSVMSHFTRWLDHDIPIALGTDAGNIPAGESVYRELALYEEAGMSTYDALQSATINAARHAGVADQLGSLEAGKKADIAVFRRHPLEQLGELSAPAMVFKGGIRPLAE
ncbi:MAG: amidohydrolase family protein [Balneolaceae bacterium]|nr:amidohydrolase family protein [Balneolaceae bacterium]